MWRQAVILPPLQSGNASDDFAAEFTLCMVTKPSLCHIDTDHAARSAALLLVQDCAGKNPLLLRTLSEICREYSGFPAHLISRTELLDMRPITVMTVVPDSHRIP